MYFFYLPLVFHTNLPNVNFWMTTLLLCVKRFYWYTYYSQHDPHCYHADGWSSLTFHLRVCYFQMLLATIVISLSLRNRDWKRHFEQEFYFRVPSVATFTSERTKQYWAKWRFRLQCSNFNCFPPWKLSDCPQLQHSQERREHVSEACSADIQVNHCIYSPYYCPDVLYLFMEDLASFSPLVEEALFWVISASTLTTHLLIRMVHVTHSMIQFQWVKQLRSFFLFLILVQNGLLKAFSS